MSRFDGLEGQALLQEMRKLWDELKTEQEANAIALNVLGQDIGELEQELAQGGQLERGDQNQG